MSANNRLVNNSASLGLEKESAVTNERKREQGLGRHETLATVLFFKVFGNGAWDGCGIYTSMKGERTVWSRVFRSGWYVFRWKVIRVQVFGSWFVILTFIRRIAETGAACFLKHMGVTPGINWKRKRNEGSWWKYLSYLICVPSYRGFLFW